MRESGLQAACLSWSARRSPSVMAVNMHGGGWCSKGFPDIVVFCGGRALAVELKTGRGYGLQEDQVVWKRRFEANGTPHEVCTSVEEFAEAVRRHLGYEDPAR